MKYYILVDCNNFYASCERIFEPALEKRPLLVLSNNDGCVVARSQEVKKLGIQMGEPYFKVRELCERLKIVVRSSNYALYGDISGRIMQILASRCEEIEVYSIDEAFITLPNNTPIEEIITFCQSIREQIKQWIGVPTSIGIAPTKTLAKIAGTFAKKSDSGIFAISSRETHAAILKKFPVEEVWGIGRRYATRLHARNIHTAFQLQAEDPPSIRRLFGVVGERLLFELRGISCLPLEKVQAKKSITASQSFGRIVTEKEELEEALASYVDRACTKLRKQKSAASAIIVFTEAIIDKETNVRLHESKTASFPIPTSDTPTIITLAKECLKNLYRGELCYKKCGVILLDLIPKTEVMQDLFIQVNSCREELAKVYDALNARYGKNTLFYAAMGIKRPWKMQSEKSSKPYTTCWDALATAKAD